MEPFCRVLCPTHDVNIFWPDGYTKFNEFRGDLEWLLLSRL